MVGSLDENGVVEEDVVPWGALLLLAAKPHHKNVPWHKYQLGICVSYQKLNQVTRPFAFPITRCYDAVRKSTQKQSILLFWTWTVVIDKKWPNSRSKKYWRSSNHMERVGGK